jgi:DNA helicase-2/ATP-dependent DNA helicase PcrA
MLPVDSWSNADRLVRVAAEQRGLLREAGLVEFDEIIEGAVDIVRGNPTVQAALSSRFPFIYVDEYQDLAPGLDVLVRSLCLGDGCTSKLFAVGDPDQAIYGWTGSRSDLLFELARHEQVTSIFLNRNYRCGSGIIQAADRLRPNFGEAVEGNPGGEISVERVDGLITGQAQLASRRISKLAADGASLHRIALLAPTNFDCREAAEVLRAEGIPCFVRSDEYRQTPATMLLEALACWASFGREESGHRLGELLEQARSVSGRRLTFAEQVSIVQATMTAAADADAGGLVVGLLETGLADRIREQGDEDQSEVASLLDSLTDGDLQNVTVQEFGRRAHRENRVEVSTMSASKGLEFDVVFILGADQEKIPFYRAIGNSEQLGEERRKFYVSVTRARHAVHMFYSGYAITKYGRVVRPGPSQFLSEMRLL